MFKGHTVFRLLLAMSFLFSGYTKFIAPGYFEITLMDQGLAETREFAAHLTRFFVGLEFALGTSLIFAFYTRKLLLFAQLLLLVFTGHLSYLWFIGDTDNCGCFGEMIAMTPEESILKNIFFFAIATVAYLMTKKKEQKSRWAIAVFVLIIGSMWLFLPIPNHETQNFSKYTHFEKAGRVDLTQGEKLVAIFNLDCEHCQAEAKELSKLKRNHSSFPSLYVLFFSEGETSPEDFERLTDSRFPYSMIDVNTFFDLIGDSPPRLYYVVEGKVNAIWDTEISQRVKERFELD